MIHPMIILTRDISGKLQLSASQNHTQILLFHQNARVIRLSINEHLSF